MSGLGTLYVVPVPIGNLEDITLRAKRILGEVDLIACEDTRTTGKLLDLLGIARPRLLSTHDYNEEKRIPALLESLEKGTDIALVSDAGTPTVSDPGFRVVRAAIEAGMHPVPLPGACALTTALCVSGLPTDRFSFQGFLPHKAGPLSRALESLRSATETHIFYVGPHHLARVLTAASSILGEERRAVIGREITKKFEEFRRGTLSELATDPGTIRGEIVLMIEGQTQRQGIEEQDVPAVIREVLTLGLSTSKTAKEVAKRTGLDRSDAYQRIMELRNESGPNDGE